MCVIHWTRNPRWARSRSPMMLTRSSTRRRRLPPTPVLSPSQAVSGADPPVVGSVPAAGGSACCRCNRFGSCKGCVCVKAGRPCVSCLPGHLVSCRNLPSPPSSTPTLLSPDGNSEANPQLWDSPINALPSLDSILSVRCPSLHHVPKGVRDAWATLFGELLTSLVASPNQIGAWCKLFMLPRASPPRGGRSHWRDILKLVRARIQKWRDGNISDLWADVIAKLKARLSRPKSPDRSAESLRRGNAIRARRAIGDGQYKKALQSLTSAGLAPPSNEVLAEMISKHPTSGLPSLPADPPPPAVEVSKEDVARALKSFPNGSAPGPSGLRANHLKRLCSARLLIGLTMP